MPATADLDAGCIAYLGPRQIERRRAFGETRQHVEFGQPCRAELQRSKCLMQAVEQVFIQVFLARKCAFPAGGITTNESTADLRIYLNGLLILMKRCDSLMPASLNMRVSTRASSSRSCTSRRRSSTLATA